MRVFRIGRPMAAGFLGVAAALGGLISHPAVAQQAATPAATSTARTVEFDIPAQNLASALSEYARQSGQQLLFSPDIVEGKQAPAVDGAYTADEALSQLLAGAGLYTATTPGGAVLISDTPNPTPPPAGSAGADGGGAVADAANITDINSARRRGVEEIIVTGQKKAERLQDVPIAISAFSMEDLQTSQIAGGPDLHLQVPNMTFTKTNFTGYSIQIRGIGTQAISATTDPAVAVALNNTPFVRNRFFEQEFFDLERLEVLRGPQGTLYGRNATAGVVNLITNKPKFDDEAKFSFDIGNYNSRRYEGMVNIPLVADTVALRIAGAATKRDGYAINEITGSPIDGRDLWSARTSLRFVPNDRLDVTLLWEHFEEDDDRLRSGKQLCKKHVPTEIDGVEIGTGGGFSGPQGTFSQGCIRTSLYSEEAFQTPNGRMLSYYTALGALRLPIALDDPYASAEQARDLRTIESTVDPKYSARGDIAELQIAYNLTDTLKLESETGYNTDDVYSLQDFNRFNTVPGAWLQPGSRREGVLQEGSDGGIFCDPQLGCSDRLVAVDVSTAESTQFSQEFRLSSAFESDLNFSLGVNFLRYDTEDKYYVFANSFSLSSALSPDAYKVPYVGGQTDDRECLLNGFVRPRPDAVYPVTGCVYIDPNPIGQVNDKGHNYFLSRNPFKLVSYGIFGETYWNITDNLKITAGARWSVDEKTAPRIPSWLLTTDSAGYPTAEVIKQTWREPTGRVVVDWKPQLSFTDETLVYGSYARGYKAGGANPPEFVIAAYGGASDTSDAVAEKSATRPNVFDPEFVNAFEIGTKNTLLDGALTFNAAAFYYNYKDYQISEIVDRSAFNRNFDAEIWGLEIEADWWAKENLRLGFKGGYQNTRIKDGEKAIDLMDRTAGNEDWVVVRPFPTFASSCILPTYLFVNDGNYLPVGNAGGGQASAAPCEAAYLTNLDPVTLLPYVPNPTQSEGDDLDSYVDYPGFDPETAPNNGEGFFKDLGGNEFPNAPNFTTTLTADYLIPISPRWMLTLHTDLYWQSESWWRVFNDHEYNRLREYFTMNLAAIFSSDDGWNIMAYLKNVTDETALTGAFLYSDDVGLTTNTFLTEPRLFGVRVTKTWGGGTFLGGLVGGGTSEDGRYPWELTIGGSLLKVDAPDDLLEPTWLDAFPTELNIFNSTQQADLDWGDERNLELTWRPGGGALFISAGARETRVAGRSEGYANIPTEPVCVLTGFLLNLIPCDDNYYEYFDLYPKDDYANTAVWDTEKYQRIDIAAGLSLRTRGLSRSSVSVGLQHAKFDARTRAEFYGTPDWVIGEGVFSSLFSPPSEPVTHTLYELESDAKRTFEGLGPVIEWRAALPLFETGSAGAVALDWTLSGGLLFGKQTTEIHNTEREIAYDTNLQTLIGNSTGGSNPISVSENTDRIDRTDSGSDVPTLGASLGLSYRVNRVRIASGYRWERYYNVLDGGFDTASGADRTMDGAYLNLSLGFGE